MESGTVFVGTSGWTYNDWAGKFYPPEVKGSQRLAFYVTRFDTVEINATFYRLPTQNMLDAWNRRLPDGFHLVVKGSRVITHLKKISDCQEPITEISRSGKTTQYIAGDPVAASAVARQRH